ncbi:glycosyltransferase family protein [Brevibacillus ginsengisoli]|uniref:glycosyltransferase family protein n=1 Tax=Brevibacillus ginsengisoli TaxID=363854 RepID=UPI003CF69F02
MRVLFLESHPKWINGLPNGFRDAGHEVKVSEAFNDVNQLKQIIAQFSPDLMITIGWTKEFSKEKQKWIRKAVKEAGVPHVFWATEDPNCTAQYSLPYIENTAPDFVFTACPSSVNLYHQKGIAAAYLGFGYYPSSHHPAEPEDKYRCRIAVVSNAFPAQPLQVYPDLCRIQAMNTLIRPLLQENIRVDFMGTGWERMGSFFEQDIPSEWNHGYLEDSELKKVYSSADILICLQNSDTKVSMETYEILASGGFLLTLDTPAIRNLFRPGVDLVVADSPESTLTLVNHYLRNPDERNRIRKQGRVAVANHHYRNRAEKIITVLSCHGMLNHSDPLFHSTILVSSSKSRKVQKKNSAKTKNTKLKNTKLKNTKRNSGAKSIKAQKKSSRRVIWYKVIEGDTIVKIARRFGVTVRRIMQLNHLGTRVLNVGQLLKIRGK